MSTTTVTSAAIVGIVLVAAIIIGLLSLHFWRKRVERLQAKALPAPEPQPIGPPLPPATTLAPQAAAIPPQAPQHPQHPQHQRHASSPPQMDGMPRVPVPTPMYIQAARRSRSTHLVSTPPFPGQAVSTDAAASPVSPASPASSTSFPVVYPAAPGPSSIPLPDSTRTSLYLSEKDVEAGIVERERADESRRSGSTDGGVRGFIRRVASTKRNSGEARVDEEAPPNEKANDTV